MSILDVVGPVVSTIISSLVALVISLYFHRKEENERFDLQLQSILQFKMEYPYLENKDFTNSWDPILINDEKFIRYAAYCSIVFNYLLDLYKWKKFNKDKLENYIAVDRWVRIHEKYWKNPIVEHENLDIYGPDFFNLINSYLS